MPKNLMSRFHEALFTGMIGVFIALSPFTVEASLSSIVVSPASSTIAVGSTEQFTAMGMFSDGSTQVLGMWATTTAIATGIEHTCALLSDGTVKCWGGNNDGQLGNGTNVASRTPVEVGSISTATSIATGQRHTCTLLLGGIVKCWGNNSHGQLGNGTTISSPRPVIVGGISGATTIASGDYSTCAILSDKIIKCWGDNEVGQLGNGATVDSPFPVTVNDISTATAITAGIGDTCALLTDSTIKCWGWNTFGQMGNGTTNYIQSTPVAVSGISDAVAITSAGSLNNCALLSNRTIKCWGDNYFGQLGNGSRISSIIPVTVSGIDTAVAVSGGSYHSCALLADNTVKCWGYNYFGQLGNGQGYDKYRQPDANIHSPTPVAVSGIFTSKAISTKFFHTCSVLFDEIVKCWGYNNAGQLGDNNGGTSPSFLPVSVLGLASSLGWSSSNTAVATISNDGLVKGMSSGSATIMATFDGVSGSTFLTIGNPSSFWSKLLNSPQGRHNLWRNIGGQNKPTNDIIKIVPNDWALKVATTTDPVGNYFDLDDGYRWYGVIDETDGAKGWMKAKDLTTGTEYLSYDASAQISLGAKASTTLYTTGETRVPVILQAVDTYYTQANTSDSLYGGGGGAGGKNNFQRFIQGSTFPKELVLAIISQESVSIKFDNEGCSSTLDGGIGIMQITSLDARGSGSNLKNYPKMGDCTAVSTSKYYSNAWQGIFANIKDGFRTLQDKFGYARKTEAVDNITEQEMKAISTVYRYNQGSPYKIQAVYEIWNGQSDDYVWNEYLKYIYKNRIRTATADNWMQKVRDVCVSETTFKNCLVKTESAGMTTSAFYLRDVGTKLHSSPFGSSYQNPTYGDKLIAANNSRLVLFLRSPAELRVVNSAGEITGSVAGEHMEEITNSVYVPEQKFVTIFFPRAQYKYRVVGLETGEYGLSADFINNSDHTFFDADYIPTHAGEIHDYTIDWNKMSRCERGSVLLEVDYEGDGIVDRVVKGSCRLSDINPPAITISSPSGSYLLNATTTVQFIATDASGIETIGAALNSVSVSNNQVISFTKPGENIILVSAIDTEGNTSTVTSTFNVLYTVNGFLQPVRPDGSGVYNQGMTLPVRFEVRDVNDKVVPSVSAKLYVAKVNNGVTGNDEIPVSTTVSSTGNQFRYDVGGHMYIFNLSTDAMSTGTWQIKAVLDSGQEIKAKVLVK